MVWLNRNLVISILLMGIPQIAFAGSGAKQPLGVYLYWHQELPKSELKRNNWIGVSLKEYRDFLKWAKTKEMSEQELIPLNQIYTSGVPILLRKPSLIKNLTFFRKSETKS